MRTWAARAALGLVLAWPLVTRAQDATVDLSQGALNKLLGRLGKLSDAGTYQSPVRPNLTAYFKQCDLVGWLDCPLAGKARIPLGRCRKVGGGWGYAPAAAPVTWSWRVTSAEFAINAGSMTFTATVVSQVDTQQTTVSRTVPTTVSYDSASRRVKINVSSFSVPVQTSAGGQTETIAVADIAKLYSVSVPIPPQAMQVWLPNGSPRLLTAQAQSVTAQYTPSVLRLTINVGF